MKSVAWNGPLLACGSDSESTSGTWRVAISRNGITLFVGVEWRSAGLRVRTRDDHDLEPTEWRLARLVCMTALSGRWRGTAIC